jgi:hypothetical protein
MNRPIFIILITNKPKIITFPWKITWGNNTYSYQFFPSCFRTQKWKWCIICFLLLNCTSLWLLVTRYYNSKNSACLLAFHSTSCRLYENCTYTATLKMDSAHLCIWVDARKVKQTIPGNHSTSCVYTDEI